MRQYTDTAGSICEVCVAGSIEEVQGLRSAWQQFQTHPNADMDFYLTLLESRPSVKQPYVVYVKSGDKISAMVLGRVEEGDYHVKVGYKTLLTMRVKSLIVNSSAFLGDCCDFVSELLMSELLGALKTHNIDMLRFCALDCGCHLLECAKNYGRLVLLRPYPHWSLESPGNIDQFFKKMGRKHRHWIRRLPRVLEHDYPGGVQYREFSSGEDISILCSDAEKIAKLTYQRSLGAGFIDNCENRRRLALAASKGCLRSYVLYVEDNPCAYWIGIKYGSKLYLNYTGYDRRYQQYSPGIILFVKMLEAVLSEGVEAIDFGSGNEVYKKRFGDCRRQEIFVEIYAPTLVGWLLYACNGFLRYLSLFSTLILERVDLLDKVKRIWRSRLTDPTSTTSKLH